MTPITHLEVSHNEADKQAKQQNQNYFKIDANLGPAGGNPVYIWYKREPGACLITRLQFSSQDGMCVGLVNAGYTRIPINLTPGGSKPLYLWYFCGSTEYDTPIVDINISTNIKEEIIMVKNGWERVDYNLQEVEETWTYLWVKREKQTYICDITATSSQGSDEDLFQRGYIRIDETTNIRPFGKISTNFLWYRQTTDAKRALTDLQLSTDSSEFCEYLKQGYTSVRVNLNEGTGENTVYLWYKKDETNPAVKSMLLLLHRSAIQPYEEPGATVIHKNISEGTSERFLCFTK